MTPRSGSLRRRLNAFTEVLEGLEEGRAGALHDARVATRRLREIVPVLGLPADAAHALSKRLQKATRRLGVVRELDVLASLVEELRDERRYSPETLSVIAAVVARKRAAAQRQLKTKLPQARLRRLTASLGDVIDQLERDESSAKTGPKRSTHAWLWALDARLAHRSNQLRAAIEATGPLYRSGRLHDVRIALKKLRYGVELSLEAGLGRTAGDLAPLKAGQDTLGRLHDLEVLIESAREAQASSARPDLAAWRGLDALVGDLEDECRVLHARYMSRRERLLDVCDRTAGRHPAPSAPRRAVS